jgi:hypothetical protein
VRIRIIIALHISCFSGISCESDFFEGSYKFVLIIGWFRLNFFVTSLFIYNLLLKYFGFHWYRGIQSSTTILLKLRKPGYMFQLYSHHQAYLQSFLDLYMLNAYAMWDPRWKENNIYKVTYASWSRYRLQEAYVSFRDSIYFISFIRFNPLNDSCFFFHL